MGAMLAAEEEMTRIEQERERHIGKRRMAQLRETLDRLCEITDPYR